MNKKMTPGNLAKMGGLTMTSLSDRTGLTRQWLLKLFHSNREAFDKILFQEMEKDLEVSIENEIAKIRTAQQIRKDMKSEFNETITLIKESK